LRQKRPLDLAFLQNLPVKERLILHTVFAMVNGNRSIDEIKAQLRLSPRDIDDALNWLYELDVIE
jgi:predicted transcriptional regulator